MHHDLDTRGIIAQFLPGINTFFDLFRREGDRGDENDKNVRTTCTFMGCPVKRISSAYYDVSFRYYSNAGVFAYNVYKASPGLFEKV